MPNMSRHSMSHADAVGPMDAEGHMQVCGGKGGEGGRVVHAPVWEGRQA